MNDPKTCLTCHWWFRHPHATDGKGVCVWHNGTKTTAAQKVFFGGKFPLVTTHDFGCTEWREDERVNEAAK